MNKHQALILFIAAAIIVVMLLFPPFQYQEPREAVLNLGYGFIFSPPTNRYGHLGTVDKGMLLVQWVAVALVGGILCFAFRDRKESDRDENSQLT